MSHPLEGIIGYLVCIVIGLFAAVVIWRMLTNDIDLKLLISEKTGEASMSRFQLLIFTFVVALSFFLIVISRANGSATSTLPDIPGGVLGLLGISASSYTVSKAIQTNMPPKQGQPQPQPPPPAGDGNGH
jgi:hypothetical protein